MKIVRKRSSSSATHRQPARLLKQTKHSKCPKAPAKAVKNVLLKSIAEEIQSYISKNLDAGKSTVGLANEVLREFKQTLPWLNHNLYSHYIKTNPSQHIIITNSDKFMQISSIESLQTMLPSDTNTQKRKKVG